uniref:Evasin n=1 Tax=Amblyomma tuberculatum TaxID=48802 RepID=A0A6M2E6J0_9ACAR
MMLLWTFTLAIGIVASAEKENIDALQGCGDTAQPSVKPEEKDYGLVIDGNSCKRKVLLMKSLELPASCIVYCASKRNYSYALPNGTPCLRFTKKKFLLERRDDSPNTCILGKCMQKKCKPRRPRRQVACTVPKDRRDLRE